MNTVSEQVKELRRFSDEYARNHVTLFNYRENMLNQAADTIEFLSAKLADMEQLVEDCGGGWIYCGEGKNLPEEYGDYLVTYGFNDVGVKVVDIGSYSENGFNIINVIAWMPQPEPYHES